MGREWAGRVVAWEGHRWTVWGRVGWGAEGGEKRHGWQDLGCLTAILPVLGPSNPRPQLPRVVNPCQIMVCMFWPLPFTTSNSEYFDFYFHSVLCCFGRWLFLNQRLHFMDNSICRRSEHLTEDKFAVPKCFHALLCRWLAASMVGFAGVGPNFRWSDFPGN